MSDNPYNGEVAFKLLGKDCIIRFGWAELSKVHAQLGPKAIRSIYTSSAEEIATMLAIGISAKNPEITAADIVAESPPFLPVLQALDKAVTYSWLGADEPNDDEAPTEPTTKKK